jgi:hypothetical protein
MSLVIRRTVTIPIALAATALLLAPSAALAAGGPGDGPPKPPAPKPSGPVQTVTRIHTPKAPAAARAITVTAHVGPAHRGRPGAVPAETGTVVFTVDGTASAPLPVKASRASEKVKLAAGKHTIDAKYSGDSAHDGSDSGPVTIEVR